MRKLASILTCVLAILSTDINAQEQAEMVNIENAAVAAYMSDSTYFSLPDSISLTSVVPTYFDTTKYGGSLDLPGGKLLEWKRTVSVMDISEIRITVSESRDMRDSLTFNTCETSDSTYTICNLYPGHTYYYKLDEFHNDGTVAHITSGCFKTEGQVRMIRVSGAHNVRDMGGWSTSFGRKIRYGRLYRSGNLDKITPVGLHDFMENMKVTAELDLRGESKRTCSALGADCDFIKIVAGSYESCLKTKGEIFVKDLEWIVSRLREGKNVDWHCAIGCDRCGTVSFLVGGILGMSEIDLGRDYELSYFAGHKRLCTTASFRGMIKFIKKQKVSDSDNFTQCFYNYLVSNGMPEEDINYLRETMLDK